MSLVLFHRNFQRFQGGHLKVFHYFEHVRSSPSHQARIRFSPDSVWDSSNPWSSLRESVVGAGESVAADVQFLAGMDWRALEPDERADSPIPIINLMQDFRMVLDVTQKPFLSYPAIRICVSPELQEALEGIPSVAGPIVTVPIGVDLEQLPQAPPIEQREFGCVVVAIKEPALGAAIVDRLARAGHRVRLVDRFLPRPQLLEAMASARVSVHLPTPVEGAYLPALESMALGTAVVCPDSVGNRSFCRDGDTCLVPRRRKRAIVRSAVQALNASPEELEPMLSRARAETMSRGLGEERARFLEILDRTGELWPSR